MSVTTLLDQRVAHPFAAIDGSKMPINLKSDRVEHIEVLHMQEITLLVPASFVLPKIYLQIDPEATAKSLTLGAHAYELMIAEGQKHTHEALFSSLQRKAAADYEPRLQELEEALQKERHESTKALEKEALKAARLKERLEEEEQRRRDTERRVREEEKANREEICAEKDTRIHSLQTQLTTKLGSVEQSLKENSRTVVDQFQSFKEQILKTTAGSKKKGDYGEGMFKDLLLRAFGSTSRGETFDIEGVGTEGHQGDLRMQWRGHRILVEVKNYDRNVESKEVTKFLRDMEEGRDVSLGIMVGLYKGIAGHTKAGRVDIEELRDGRICVYLTEFMLHEDPILVLQSLKPFLETFLDYRSKSLKATDRSADQDDEESLDTETHILRLEQQKTTLLALLNSHSTQVTTFKNTLVNAKKKNDQIWLELLASMKKTEHDVKLLLSTILDTEFSTEDSATDALPEYLVVETNLTLHGEKDRKFLQDTLKHFDIHEDLKTPTKDIKEAYKSLGYSDDFISGARTRLFQGDVWPSGKKDVKYLKMKERV
jgi:hypothetical protein